MYKVIYTETLVHTFPVEANSYEEAEHEFMRMLDESEIDFTDGIVEESSYEIKEERNAQ